MSLRCMLSILILQYAYSHPFIGSPIIHTPPQPLPSSPPHSPPPSAYPEDDPDLVHLNKEPLDVDPLNVELPDEEWVNIEVGHVVPYLVREMRHVADDPLEPTYNDDFPVYSSANEEEVEQSVKEARDTFGDDSSSNTESVLSSSLNEWDLHIRDNYPDEEGDINILDRVVE